MGRYPMVMPFRTSIKPPSAAADARLVEVAELIAGFLERRTAPLGRPGLTAQGWPGRNELQPLRG